MNDEYGRKKRDVYKRQVWKKIDRTFSITGNRKELLELFPEPYVDFLLQVVRYNGALHYALFEGEVSQDIDD